MQELTSSDTFGFDVAYDNVGLNAFDLHLWLYL